MKALRNLVLTMVVLVVAVNLVSGNGAAVVALVAAIANLLSGNLRTVMVAVAVPVLLLGGLMYASPWHHELGGRLMTGAIAVLVIAELGPPFLHWLDGELAAYGARLFGSRP